MTAGESDVKSKALMLSLGFALLFVSCSGPQIETVDVPEGALGGILESREVRQTRWRKRVP